jgi:hypothetical protein
MTITLSAQEMSIEFSIEWKDKLNFTFNELADRDLKPTFLNITYRNITSKALYCLKITEGKAGLPEILFFYNFKEPSSERFPIVGDDYFKRRYFVGFKNNPDYNMNLTWDIRNDTTDIEYKIIKETRKRPIYDILCDGCSTGYIDGDTVTLNDWLFSTLNTIYNYIYNCYYPKTKRDDKAQTSHNSSDITQDTIMNNSINKFVFLKPGETYVDKYNLIGFQITGGTFTFQLDDTKSLDYVETGSVNEAKFGTACYLRKQLPLKVGEYELFTGEFLTNKVSVSFPGIKLKE